MSTSAIPTLPSFGPWTRRIVGGLAALLLILVAVLSL